MTEIRCLSEDFSKQIRTDVRDRNADDSVVNHNGSLTTGESKQLARYRVASQKRPRRALHTGEQWNRHQL